ncbi:MAG: baseplate J/gp47 family protein [Acetobacteraceae bacterium]|nr:baseplate J/gp47 family protein [Acetobacteraceae bacterium]MBV8575997.1 baseplate J/gp47 family protein [Acetobacteraceae bacterium]
MQLSLQTFSTLVQNMAASVQSAASQAFDVTVGSTVRAILEANASVALWMQWLILQVLQSTRAATSNGADLDTWMADFTLTRLPAVAATGTVTLSRHTTTMPALIAPGVLVRTGDGAQTFSVVADTSNPAWNSQSAAYVLGAGISSITVPVAAQVPGSAGNVQGATVTLLATAVPGVDTVVNASPFTNGLDAETDAAFRARFQSFIQSRSRATSQAVGYAVTSVQQGLQYTVQENVSSAGLPVMGSFVVTVDDGSGNPSSALLSAVRSAVDLVRPIGSVFTVQPPAIVPAAVSLSILAAPGAAKPSVVANVSTALTAYVNALPVGASLSLTRLAQVAYAADPGVQNVTNLLINGGGADLLAPPAGAIKVSSMVVS